MSSCHVSGLESLQMPPTPPSSHGSDSEGSQSPVHAPPGLSCPTSPTSPAPSQANPKVSPRAASSLSNSPLLTAPHVSGNDFTTLFVGVWNVDARHSVLSLNASDAPVDKRSSYHKKYHISVILDSICGNQGATFYMWETQPLELKQQVHRGWISLTLSPPRTNVPQL